MAYELEFSEDGKTLERVIERTSKHITLPKGVIKIRFGAFIGCRLLETIDILTYLTEIHKDYGHKGMLL